MIQVPLHRLALAVGENCAKHLGLTDFVKRSLGRTDCGGVRWADQSIHDNVAHVRLIADSIATQLDVAGKVGVEIGPGDNLGAAYCLLKRGAREIYAVEKFGSIAADERCKALFRQIDRTFPGTPFTADVIQGDAFSGPLHHARSLFEEFQPASPADFVYSYDVLEHVEPPPVFRHAFEILNRGGDFVSVIDLTGHGVFYSLKRPLDFLTCPDWLWRWLFSAMETTNRVRWSQLLTLARATGFEIMRAEAIRRADPAYLTAIRPHLLPRYQALADEDLSVMQCVLHLRKP